jgi:hypothetical protein
VLRSFATLGEALAFLQEMDSTLPNLPQVDVQAVYARVTADAQAASNHHKGSLTQV